MPKWKREQLEAALKEVETGKGKEKKHGIPSSTLHDHVRKKVSKSGAGKPTVLTQVVEEEELVYSEKRYKSQHMSAQRGVKTPFIEESLGRTGRLASCSIGLSY